MSRYHRQELLPQLGEAGQQRLAASCVLIAGCGALGCTIADLLARAGVGRLRIIDRDLVETTNLQRQVLFSESDVGLPKATAAANRLRSVNSSIEIEAHVVDLNATSIKRLTTGCDVIVDGLDNFETRYLLNDLAVSTGVPFVYGGAVGTEGLSLAILPVTGGDSASPWSTDQSTACLRCLFPEPPAAGVTATCDTAGVLGPLAVTVAAHEAMQVIKILAGCLDDLDRSVLSIDAWRNDIRRLAPPSPNPDCPCCGQGQFEWLNGERGHQTTMLCGRDAVQVLPGTTAAPQADGHLQELSRRLSAHGTFTCRDGVLRGTLREERSDAGDPIELTVFEDLRAMVGRIESSERARAIYDRYIGA
ncbi:MAG: ThiF family adenylyltransferase [Phycisphaerales bacterium]|nr:ThiF family adenylyltransferase [Phycisphaerales bacterium]